MLSLDKNEMVAVFIIRITFPSSHDCVPLIEYSV